LEVTSEPPAARGPLGELSAQAGYARQLGLSAPGEGPYGRIHLLARLGSHLALGPEAALYRFSSRPGGGNGERQLFQLGGLARAGVDLGAVRPAALLGLAWYNGSLSFVAYSVGAEAELHFARGLPPLVLEARYHDNLQNLGQDPRYLSLGAGLRTTW
jgi:hypothetical protein